MWITLRKWLIRNPADRITPREWEVIIAICVHELDGQGTADRLRLEKSSIRQMLSHIYRKLEISGILELREWFDRNYPSAGMNYRDYDDDE